MRKEERITAARRRAAAPHALVPAHAALRRASRAAATLPSADARARRQLAPAAADAPDHGPIAPRPQSRRIDLPQAAATAVTPYLPTASRRDRRSERARPRRNLLTHGTSGSPPHDHRRARTSAAAPHLLTHATTRSPTHLTAALARWGPSTPPRPPPTPPRFCSSSARSTLFPPALWGSTRLCPARHAPLGRRSRLATPQHSPQTLSSSLLKA